MERERENRKKMKRKERKKAEDDKEKSFLSHTLRASAMQKADSNMMNLKIRISFSHLCFRPRKVIKRV